MFALSHPNSSEKILEEFLNFEEESFSNLGLYLRTLDMPPCELGAPAYRKYDIEAWLPGRKMFGELSSCSNCTDYQARRLGIKYRDNDKFDFVHTLNGTACAIPRMLISIVETNQNSNGTITVPDVLLKYMKGKKFISKQRKIPELRLIKNKKNI